MFKLVLKIIGAVVISSSLIFGAMIFIAFNFTAEQTSWLFHSKEVHARNLKLFALVHKCSEKFPDDDKAYDNCFEKERSIANLRGPSGE